jgi:hypothetical protein
MYFMAFIIGQWGLAGDVILTFSGAMIARSRAKPVMDIIWNTVHTYSVDKAM